MTEKILTYERAHELLQYDPETGVITNRINRGRARAGAATGGKMPDGYVRVTVDYKPYPAHRIIWLMEYGYFPANDIDHINQIRHDNRIKNLRVATRQENLRNAKLSVRNTSGVCGVYWRESSKKWRATIILNGKNKHIGFYADWFDAVCARKSADVKYGFHANHGR